MTAHQRLWSHPLALAFVVLPALAWLCPIGSARTFSGEPDQASEAVRDKFFEQNVRPLLAPSAMLATARKSKREGYGSTRLRRS